MKISDIETKLNKWKNDLIGDMKISDIETKLNKWKNDLIGDMKISDIETKLNKWKNDLIGDMKISDIETKLDSWFSGFTDDMKISDINIKSNNWVNKTIEEIDNITKNWFDRNIYNPIVKWFGFSGSDNKKQPKNELSTMKQTGQPITKMSVDIWDKIPNNLTNETTSSENMNNGFINSESKLIQTIVESNNAVINKLEELRRESRRGNSIMEEAMP